MGESKTLNAELVMRREDGRSILDLEGPVTAGSEQREAGDLPPERIAEIRKRLEQAGFTVEGGNANTLSISGAPALFAEVFGLDPAAPGATDGAHATRIRRDLEPFVAECFVTAPPDFFP
jgi:hypothetical protein